METSIQLKSIENSPLYLEPHEVKGYWRLMGDAYITLVTDEGHITAHLLKGWVTDKRSGSDAINLFVPKWCGPYSTYSAIVAFHDCYWSGWISRALSDELLRQGMILSGKVSERRAAVVKFAVDHFGHYYDLSENLPGVYKFNRSMEGITWTH